MKSPRSLRTLCLVTAALLTVCACSRETRDATGAAATPTGAPAPVARPLTPQQIARETLAPGRYQCSFREAGTDYNRGCVVTAESGDALRIAAEGTAVNPGTSLNVVVRGARPRYRAQGTLNAFARCAGQFDAPLALVGSGAQPKYVASWGDGCSLTITL